MGGRLVYPPPPPPPNSIYRNGDVGKIARSNGDTHAPVFLSFGFDRPSHDSDREGSRGIGIMRGFTVEIGYFNIGLG